ncbi:dihydrodipicolinate synthase family protein [Occultella glacieicola]|uniref:Dihydrodipicolinate synthase family protein n=1 Tax=Occultella glacieicola TaxID=2518684 RepID=A0ABY2E4E0_9MICO|nr:dihydrodipicolinate synthase family protein [Occultella glacieicola]TDE93975.1 dihydrodipicolinate synthase family protein [Occultella glacieicola]
MPTPLPDGAWPVMLTPFRADRSIDWEQVEAYADWLVDLGSAGVFTVALSSEMYDLTPVERLELAGRVVGAVDGRVPVIASAVGGSVDEIAESAAGLAEAGVTAAVLVSPLLATPDEPDSEWIRTAEQILDRVPGLDFGVYECPVPYKRLLTLETVRWMSGTGRFTFFKDTSHRADVMAARIDVLAGSPLRHYNAEISSLVESLGAGGAGFSGYAANIYPELVAWLCANHATAPQEEVATVQQVLSIAEHSINARYPSSAKFFLAHSSRLTMSSVSRWKPEGIGPHEGQPLIDLARYLEGAGLPALTPGRR